MNNKIKPMRGSVNSYHFEELQHEPTSKEFKWQGLIFQLDLISERTIYYNENPYIHIFISKPVYDKHHTSNIRYQFLIKKTKLEVMDPLDPFCDIAAKEIEVHQSLVNTPDKTPFISSHTIDNFRRIIFEPQAYNLRDIVLMLKEAEKVMAHKKFMEIFNSRKKSYLAIIILKSFLDLIFRNGNNSQYQNLHLIYGNINCSNILFSFEPDDNNTKYEKLHCYLVDINRQGKYQPDEEHFAQTLAIDLKNLTISIIQFLNNFDQTTEQSSIPTLNSSLINLKETQFLKKLPVVDETNSFSTLHRFFQKCLKKKWIDFESLRPVYDILCEPKYSKKCRQKANNFINRLYKTTKIEPYSRFLK